MVSIKNIWNWIKQHLGFAPISLAKKCRLAFGAAIVLVLVIALSIPYVWMGKLTLKASIDAGRAKTDALFTQHFTTPVTADQIILPPLNSDGTIVEPNEPKLKWIVFGDEDVDISSIEDDSHREMTTALLKNNDKEDDLAFETRDDQRYINYVRVVRAKDSCLACHNPQGAARAFGRGEPVGVALLSWPASMLTRTTLLNLAWISVAGLIAGAGAIVTFYAITQRVILRPIRQLRGLANNVAEGNLDVRSSIRTGDEYEKLAEAFNHMLDNLGTITEKLRKSNKHLDEKILELSQRNIELFKANQLKGEFLANISHEFRTPLNAILGFSDILRQRAASIDQDKIRRYAENIDIAGKNLLNLINDLLDLAKTEAGKMTLHVEQTHIPTLCREVIASFSSLTRKKRIKVKTEVDEEIPPMLTDAGKIRQILYNFLSNSVKFTPELGRIIVTAQRPNDVTVRISVTDTGCGIALDEQQRIFEKFRQADGTITRTSGGTGLGLAISRELASLLAGSIGLESQEGKGTTFWVDIPIQLVKEEKPNPTELPKTD